MSGYVCAALSHKGGTGRSVTSANVAYHLATSYRKSVCIFDLDVASPTMGAVLGFNEIGAGVEAPGSAGSPKSFGDFVRFENAVNSIDRALIDIWSSRDFANIHKSGIIGDFRLLPGSKHLGDLDKNTLKKRIPDLIMALKERFDIVYLDLRSGASDLVDILRQSSRDETEFAPDRWLCHFRWTRQHLVGIEDILEMLKGIDNSRKSLIRTAFISPTEIASGALRTLVINQNQDMQNRLKNMNVGGVSPWDLIVGTIPLDSILQWKESIITRDMVTTQLAKEETYQAYQSVAKFLKEASEKLYGDF